MDNWEADDVEKRIEAQAAVEVKVADKGIVAVDAAVAEERLVVAWAAGAD